MIAVLSPAKTLDLDSPLPAIKPTRPRFAEEAATLARSAARLPQKRLRELMSISPALAKLNHDRFTGFAEAAARPALYTFAGDVYRGLDAATMDEVAVDFAQGHLRLLSGCTGCSARLTRSAPTGWRWACAGRRAGRG